MATLLDDRLVADALASNLEDWSGDAQRISRTVQVDDTEALLAAVSETADAMDHHPQVEQDDAGVTFVLWTHSAGGVTELDIALAARIDDLVLTTQGEQRVGAAGTVTPEANFPTPGQTTPSRPDEATTGDRSTDLADAARDAPTMNEPSAPRQDAGMIVAPDAEPHSVEPQPGNAPAPGMHEKPDAAAG